MVDCRLNILRIRSFAESTFEATVDAADVIFGGVATGAEAGVGVGGGAGEGGAPAARGNGFSRTTVSSIPRGAFTFFRADKF